MQPLTTVPEYIAYVKARPDLPMCPIRLALRSIGGKWKLLIVLQLFGASALRFSALRRGIGDITNSMLSSCLQELEGEEGFRHLEEYCDARTGRYDRMVEGVCRRMRVTTLRYQTLKGMLDAIGIDPDKVCTYCWTGRE